MKYLSVFVLTVILFLPTVAGLNWLVDPYGMYWSPQINNLNTLKPESGDRVRTTKPKRVSSVSPKTVLIGNSRIEMGLSAKSDIFDHQPVYNLGMPGIGLTQQLNNAARQIILNDNLKELIFSLDYLDFLYDEEILDSFDYSENQFANFSASDSFNMARAKEYLGFLISLNTLVDSINTVFKQGGQYNHIDESGTNIPRTYLAVMRYEGVRPLFIQKIEEMRKRLKTSKRKLVSVNAPDKNPGVKMLNDLITLAREKGIEVKLFINPYHYSYLHVLEEGNHFDDYLKWKILLTTSLAENESEKPELWDFSGFNEVTLQKLDTTAEKPYLSWFWEPAHYRSSVGKKILEQLYGRKEQETFGKILNDRNVSDSTMQEREGLNDSRQQWKGLEKFLYRL